MDDLIETYTKLRDAKADLKAQIGAISAQMDRIEAQILNKFNELGVDSAKTKHGTAYRTIRTTVNVADWDVALDWVRTHQYWAAINRRISKEAVEAWAEEHGDYPPGVNVRREAIINIRRS